MKHQVTPPPEITATTEALLEGLIAECHAIIRDGILPAVQAGKYDHWHNHIQDVTDMMEAAVKLADAVGRLRRPEPPPELRQRITVEKIQSLPAPKAAP
jgi:hypothetical protein